MMKTEKMVMPLAKIQNELKAPKNQFNSFGKYHYRNAEDILEALKPILLKYGCNLHISDEIKAAGSIIYVESKVTICYEGESVSVTAQAGIDPNRKGMDISQAFGASSSYARKYALGGLFLLDDSKDADATNTHGKEDIIQIKNNLLIAANKLKENKEAAIASIKEAKTIEDLKKIEKRLIEIFNQ